MNTLKLKLKNNKSGSLPAIRQHITEISRMGGLSKKVNLSQKQTRNNLNEYQSSYKAKQLIKEFYGGLSETWLRNLAKKRKNISLISLIERRLDVVVFRLGFAKSINEAKYLIKTNQIFVNNILVKDPAYLLKNGSTITSKSVYSYLSIIMHEKLNLFKLPTHLFIKFNFNSNNNEKFIGFFLKSPLESEVYLPYNFPINKFNNYIYHY